MQMWCNQKHRCCKSQLVHTHTDKEQKFWKMEVQLYGQLRRQIRFGQFWKRRRPSLGLVLLVLRSQRKMRKNHFLTVDHQTSPEKNPRRTAYENGKWSEKRSPQGERLPAGTIRVERTSPSLHTSLYLLCTQSKAAAATASASLDNNLNPWIQFLLWPSRAPAFLKLAFSDSGWAHQ